MYRHFMKRQKVRPEVLLWSLFLMQLVVALLLYGQARAYSRKASALDAKEPEMLASVERAKDRIHKETDIATLRSMPFILQAQLCRVARSELQISQWKCGIF